MSADSGGCAGRDRANLGGASIRSSAGSGDASTSVVGVASQLGVASGVGARSSSAVVTGGSGDFNAVVGGEGAV